MAAKPLRTKLMRAAMYLWGDDHELGDVVAHIRTGNGHANKAEAIGARILEAMSLIRIVIRSGPLFRALITPTCFISDDHRTC